jgi:hypothetical protein
MDMVLVPRCFSGGREVCAGCYKVMRLMSLF